MTELTAKKYLESKGLNDHDYQDSGIIDHISEMMEEYHQAKLHLLTIPVVIEPFYCNSDDGPTSSRCKEQCFLCRPLE